MTSHKNILSNASVSPVGKQSFVLPAPSIAPNQLCQSFDPSKFNSAKAKVVPNDQGRSEAPKIPTGISQSTGPVTASVDLATVTNATFVAAIFENAPDGASALVCSKYGEPTEGAWIPKPATQVYGCAANTNNYVNCATFKSDTDGSYHARKANAVVYCCLVLDDVGTKAARNGLGGVKPSWKIETSPGNYQVGFILKNPLTNPEDVTRLQNAVVAAGLCDPGATGMTRWVRLPVGINGKAKYKDASGKPFHCRLTEWHPEAHYSVEELVAEFKLNMDAAPAATELDATEKAIGHSDADGEAKTLTPTELSKLEQLLAAITPDCSHKDWIDAMMAVHHATGGSDEGFKLVDTWSSKATKDNKYKGTKDVEVQWRSLDKPVHKPITIGTLIKMAREAGADVVAIMGEQFEPCETEVVLQSALNNPVKASDLQDPLARFSLAGRTHELEAQMVEQKPILGEILLQGQASVIYAPPNTGKTLILLHLIIDAIKNARFTPSKLYYINMDDNSAGLVEKNRLADEYGFNMLADGHQGFKVSEFRLAMEEMIETGTAKGIIVVMDTVKKVVNPMIKNECRAFTKMARRFSMKGGTFIGLSHVNKNRAPDGKVVYAGTSDIVDDFDCAYALDILPQQPVSGKQIVCFENRKNRGGVAMSAAYGYTRESGASYSEILASVQEVNPAQLEPIKQAAALLSDEVVIAAIQSCIGEGVTSKMKLADAAADRTKASKRAAMQVLEKYTGELPGKHLWRFVVRDRGAKVFELLPRPAEPAAAPDDQTA